MALANIERLITESTGLDPASIGASAVERAVRQRQRACRVDELETYWDLVRASPAELQALIESVVVGETWFFRDIEAFGALRAFVQDEWLPSHPAGALRLLSLPCATGEEPYSMAITLLDAGLPKGRFHLDAVDISERALKNGRRGQYSRRAFRGNLAEMPRGRFTQTATGWRVTDMVRQHVHFHQGNVLSSTLLPEAEAYDVIFSRNLLIYFDRTTQDRAIDVLSGLLGANGILFVGPTEAVAFINRGFVPQATPRAFAFRKAGVSNQGTGRVVPPMPLRLATRQTEVPVKLRSDERKHEALSATVDGRQPTAGPREEHAALAESTSLANQGRFEEAVQCCQNSIHDHGPSPDAFYLLGLIRDATGDTLEAMSCYRKALYLDPQHENALMHLALLLEALGRKPEAQRLRTRARRTAFGGDK